MYTNKSFIKIWLSSSVVIAAIYLEQKFIIIDTLIIINMLEINHMNVRCVQNQFCYKSNLSRHMITCSGNYVENFKCSHCEKVMKTSFSLKDHIEGKYGAKNKVCSCGKTFAWRTSLLRHQNICTVHQ